MKLTCVTATRNIIKAGNAQALIRCVESVAKIKVSHEHLIYDGASTDGTVELLMDLAGRYSNVKVVSEKDTGIYNALNKGVRDAHGEWYYVLGADDYICAPDGIDEIIDSSDALDEIIVAPVEASDGNTTAKFKLQSIQNIFSSTPYCHQGMLAKTCVMRRYGGFDERFMVCADYDLMLKAHLDARRIRLVEKPFATYGVDGLSSISNLEIEYRAILSERLNFVVTEELYRRGRYPFHYMWRYFWHRDRYVRMATQRMAQRGFKMLIRKLFYPLVVVTRPFRYRKCA